MKVRITKVTDPSCWYATQIGEEFEVEPYDYNWYKVGLGSRVFIDDCEPVAEPDKKIVPTYPNRLWEAAHTNKMVARYLKEAALHAQLYALAAQFRDYERDISDKEPDTTTAEPDRLADNMWKAQLAFNHELSDRVKALEEAMEYEIKRVDTIITEDAAQLKGVKMYTTETNLEKAKRLYPKGTRFKSMGMVTRDDIYVSSGAFTETHDGFIFMQEMIDDKPIMRLVYNGSDWATIIPAQPTAWKLRIDIPEWVLKKGQESDFYTDEFARFKGSIGITGWYYIPLSIMPHIAEEVEG